MLCVVASRSTTGPDTDGRSTPLSYGPPRRPRLAGDRPKSVTPPATGTAAIPAAPGPCARPAHAVPLGSFAELSCQKIVFDLQLADLPVQKINLRLTGRSLHRGTAALENARCTVQQLLLPVVDLVRMDPKLTRQLGDRPVPSDRRQRHLRLKRRVVLRPRPLHVLLLRYPRFLGAGLHLSQLSHFRGPPQNAPNASLWP